MLDRFVGAVIVLVHLVLRERLRRIPSTNREVQLYD
jgi:hypothetical protein